jgi:hypothetical protein
MRHWVQSSVLQKKKKKRVNPLRFTWWHIPVIPALCILRQEDREFKAAWAA